MENFSHFNNASLRFGLEIWINDLVFNNILLIITIYLVIAQIYYYLKVKKHMKPKCSQLTLDKKYCVQSKYICSLIGICSMVRSLTEIGLRSIEWNAAFFNDSAQPTTAANTACYVLPHISVYAAIFGHCFVYVFLWSRQIIFYAHPTLNVLYNNKLKTISFSILPSYLLLVLSLSIIHLVRGQHALNKAGFCVLQLELNVFMAYVKFLIAGSILSTAMQLLLLGLFIYPLLKQSSWHKNEQGMQNHRMLQLVRKSVILASVSVITDIITAVSVNIFFDNDTNNPTIVHSLNLVINYLIAIGIFSYWKKLFWPWSKTKE